MYTLFRRQVERIFGTDGERRIPGVHVSHDAVHPICGRRMGVARNLVLDLLIAHDPLPDLSPSEEEALIARIAVDERSFSAA